MTAEQILEVIKNHYSESDFAYNKWSEWNQPEDFKYSEKVEQAKALKEAASAKLQTHPDYSNHATRGESYKIAYQEYTSVPSEWYQKQKEILDYLGLGEVEEVEQYGGEGQGDTWYSVKYFKDHDVYIRIDGWYQSYNGTEFYNGYGSEVRPTKKEIVVFE